MFADRLKTLRAEKGITQVQLAEILGVTKGTVAMWETGKREPNFETLEAFIVSPATNVGGAAERFIHVLLVKSYTYNL